MHFYGLSTLYRIPDQSPPTACYSNVKQLREQYKDVFMKKHNMKLGFMSAFVKATAYALQDMPVVNAVIDENDIVYRDYVDISVAVATPKVYMDMDMLICAAD